MSLLVYSYNKVYITRESGGKSHGFSLNKSLVDKLFVDMT